MRIKHLTLPVSALLAAGALAACGSSSSSGNGVASKSANGIISAASQAVSELKSVHIVGSITSGGKPVALELHLVAGKGATGQMTLGGQTLKLTTIGSNLYISASASAWQALGNAALAQKMQGKWLKATTTGTFSSYSSLTNLHALFSQAFASHGTLAKGQTTTVDGQQVIAVRDTTKGGTLYVATNGKPYPVEVRKAGSQVGTVVFDQYNQPVSLSAPANVIDSSAIGL